METVLKIKQGLLFVESKDFILSIIGILYFFPLILSQMKRGIILLEKQSSSPKPGIWTEYT